MSAMTLGLRERRLLQALVIMMIAWLTLQIVAEVWRALAAIADVLLVFIVAWALAFLLSPLVGRIDRGTRLSRPGAVGVVYVAIAVILAGLLATALPGLASQLRAIAQRGPEYGERAARLTSDVQDALRANGLPVNLDGLAGSIPTRLGEVAAASASDALGFVSATAGLLFDLVLVLIIAFIMLIDGERLWARFTKALSEEFRSEAELFRFSADRAFGGFVRGSLIVGLVYGLITFATLVPLGVPFAGLLSALAGLAVIIPFFGPVIALVPVFVITLLTVPDSLLVVLLITLAVQQVMFNVVSPRILSRSVGVHPLLVFAALLIGARVAGFWGVFLALPVTGIGAIFLRYGYEVARGRRTRSEAANLMEGRRPTA